MTEITLKYYFFPICASICKLLYKQRVAAFLLRFEMQVFKL